MNGNFLLDRNIVIDFLRNDETVARKVTMIEEISISCTVLGELYFGAMSSKSRVRNLAIIDKIAERFPVMPVDSETGKIYGELKSILKSEGRPIPENDHWIAALAIQHDMILVTRDSHFQLLANLNAVDWRS